MPDVGYYEKIPRRGSIEKLIEYLGTNPVVTDVVEVRPQVIQIERDGKSTLTVFMTNIYHVSDSDVLEISAANQGLSAIVTMSAWNGYTNSAKQRAKKMGIGLFKFAEFLGAVYYDKERFLDYTPPERD